MIKTKNKIFTLFFLTTALYATAPMKYAQESDVWFNEGGEHGGITPSGQINSGLTGAGSGGGGGTFTNGPTADAGGGTSMSPTGEGFTDSGGNDHGMINPAGKPSQGLGGPGGGPGAGAEPNLPANNNADGGGPGDGFTDSGGNDHGTINPAGKPSQGLGGPGGGDNTASGDGSSSNGTGDDSYVSSNEGQTNGEQEEKNRNHEQEINTKAIGFQFKPYPVLMVDGDAYTHIINLDTSGVAGFTEDNAGKKIPTTSSKGFKVVQMRRGSLTLGVGLSGGLTGVISDAFSAGLPKIDANISVSAGGTHVAERYVATYEEAKKLKKKIYTKVPSTLEAVVEEMNIGDSLAYKVDGTLAAAIGVKAMYGTVGAGVGASITGSWTTHIQRVKGLTNADKSVRVQVSYVSGKVREANVNGTVLGGKAASKWYDSVDETIAYEFNLSTKKGLALYKEMLKGNIIPVKYAYMKKLGSAEELNRALKGWYWSVKKNDSERASEFIHKKLLEEPTPSGVKATVLAGEVFINKFGGLKKFEELSLMQVQMLGEIANISRSTLTELINHKKEELRLKGAARENFIAKTYKVQFLPYYRISINKDAMKKEIKVRNGFQPDLVNQRLVEYKKRKFIDDKNVVNLKNLKARSIGLRWKKKAMDKKKMKDAFAMYVDAERVQVLRALKSTFDVFMISVAQRTAYGSKKTISSGVPVLFSFNYNRGNPEQSVVTGTMVQDGVLLKNYIGSYKAENRTMGLLSNHHTRTTAFYGGIVDLTFVKPSIDRGVNKKIKIFASLKYAYDRDDANEGEWADELKNLSERVGYRDMIVARPRPYDKKANYLQLSADWILSQEAIEFLIGFNNGGKLSKNLLNLANTALDEWFEKNTYDMDNLGKLTDDSLREQIKGRNFKYIYGAKTQSEILALGKPDLMRKKLNQLYYNDHKEICTLSKVGTQLTRDSCKSAYQKQIVKDVSIIAEALSEMSKNNPLNKTNTNKGLSEYDKLAKAFTKSMAKLGKGIVNNQFIVRGLQKIVHGGKVRGNGVDQYAVVQWQGSAKVKKGKNYPLGKPSSFRKGSFELIPSSSYFFRGNEVCASKAKRELQMKCLPREFDPI